MKWISIFILLMFSVNIEAQNNGLTWEDITKTYKFTGWYTGAKFYIWVHWGAQTEPQMGGGWYARHMYMEGVGYQLRGRMHTHIM